MKRLYQTVRHVPEEGKYGDCQRAVFACLLDLDSVDKVPHFLSDNPPAGVFWDRINAWLGQVGYKLVSFRFEGDTHRRDVLRTMGRQNPGVFYMLGGNSFSGVGHVVICLGDSVYHDPSPSHVDVIAPGNDGFWRVELLVPIAMTTLVRTDGMDMLVPWNGGQTGTALPPEPEPMERPATGEERDAAHALLLRQGYEATGVLGEYKHHTLPQTAQVTNRFYVHPDNKTAVIDYYKRSMPS